MNWFIFIAGLISLFTTVGHFVIGGKEFLVPMLKANFEEIPKKVMHSVFHYISAYLILATAVLLLAGSGVDFTYDLKAMVLFIAVNYGAFAVIQIAIALTSKINNPIFKLFQWTFFVAITVLSFLGL